MDLIYFALFGTFNEAGVNLTRIHLTLKLVEHMFIDELIFQGRLLMIDECCLVLLLLKLILFLFYVVLIMHARITQIF